MTELFSLKDLSVLITGGSRGIGYGIATVFARAGANVAVAGRSKDDLDRSVDGLRTLGEGQVISVVTDVSRPQECVAMAEQVSKTFGGIDVLCANAGIFPQANLADMTPEQLEQVLAVNVKGNVYSVQACLDALTLSGRGRVILTSSITGPLTGFPGWSHYGASKSAQLGFMRTAAIELAPRHITVNAIMPGNVESEGLSEMGADYIEGMTRSIPLRRLGKPEEIGSLAAFLATEEASYITGQAIAVDGGQVLPESPDAVL